MRQPPHAVRAPLAQTFSPTADQPTQRNEIMNTRNRFQNYVVATLVALVSVTVGLLANAGATVQVLI
jgi:hypothetical protein